MGKEFNLIGETMFVDQERANYNELKQYFIRLADEASRKFVDMYEANNTRIEDVYTNARDQGDQCIKEVIEKAVSLLFENDILDISTQKFIEDYITTNYYKNWLKVYEEISDKYIEIIAGSEELDRHRTQRRQSRGKVVGGGFGLDGAVKGMATAGAMNMASGAVHGVFNLAAKGVTAAVAASEKKTLFKDHKTMLSLSDAVYDCCYYIHYRYLDYLIEKRAVKKHRFVTQPESDKAKSMFENIENPSFPEEKRVEILIEILELNPYRRKYYEYIFDNYGDQNGVLQNIADYFNVSIYNHKVKSLNAYFKTLKVDSEEDAHIAKEKLLEQCRQISLNTDNEVVDNINRTIEKYDLEFRTVSEIEFATREEASLAKEEKEQLEDLLANIQDTEEILEEAIKEVNEKYKTQIKGKYLEELEEKKLVYYNAKIALANKYVEESNLEDEDAAIATRQGLLIYMEEINLPRDNRVIDEVDNTIRVYDQKFRTVDSIEFATREEAIFAKEEKEELEKFIAKIENTEEALAEAIEKVNESYKTQIKEKYIKELEVKKQGCFNTKLSLADKYVKESGIGDEAAAISTREGLLIYMQEINLPQDNDVLVSLNKKIYDYDRRARTFSSIEFETRELAEKAKDEKKQFDRIMSDAKAEGLLSTKENIQEVIKELDLTGETILKEEYIKNLQGRINRMKLKEEAVEMYKATIERGKEEATELYKETMVQGKEAIAKGTEATRNVLKKFGKKFLGK